MGSHQAFIMVGFLSLTLLQGTGLRLGVLALALALAQPLASGDAQARAGLGGSFGSRGARTYSPPPATTTAPRASQPIFRSETPQPGASASGYAGAARPGGFGFGSGLMAGVLGAGLFGLLTGGGFGGIGGGGLLLQLLLIGGLVFLALRFFRGNRAPAFAGLGAPQPINRSFVGPAAGGAAATGGAPLAIGPQDYAAFEGALVDVQTAFGREDLNALSRLTTPEMLRAFGSQIEDNRRHGQRNDVSDARLLQGDLAEAWREAGCDYATLAMRFTVRDVMVDRAGGRILSGDANAPTEATEMWTFRRDRGGAWLLSAIQQAG